MMLAFSSFLEAQMEQSPRLSLSYVMPAQAQKHVTVNETFRRLDQLVQQMVVSRALAAEPGSPAEGDAYILPAGPTGASWGSYSQNNIAAYQDGAWIEIVTNEGFTAWVADVDEFAIFDGVAWSQVSGGGSEAAAKFGVNTTADTTNKLSVKSNAVLFDSIDVGESGDGGCQVKVNKEAAGDTASHLFQTGFSGRAEFGLTGSDDFQIKVSADGAVWNDALTIDKATGHITAEKELSISGQVNIADPSPRIVFQDSNGTGDAQTGLFAFHDNADVQKAWFGFGSTGNSEFSFFNSYTSDTVFYTSGTKRGYIGASGGLVIGTPTGADKGAGTINASNIYDDNTLLSCYVFDQVIDGAIDDVKWDAKVPDQIVPARTEIDENSREERVVEAERRIPRLHGPMRRFKARLGCVDDPLTLDGYAKHWRDKRHLTSMPNEAAFDAKKGLTTGEWIQRVVETVEIQAVLIEQLNARVKACEASGGQ